MRAPLILGFHTGGSAYLAAQVTFARRAELGVDSSAGSLRRRSCRTTLRGNQARLSMKRGRASRDEVSG
jgi:hypothetical protein